MNTKYPEYVDRNEASRFASTSAQSLVGELPRGLAPTRAFSCGWFYFIAADHVDVVRLLTDGPRSPDNPHRHGSTSSAHSGQAALGLRLTHPEVESQAQDGASASSLSSPPDY